MAQWHSILRSFGRHTSSDSSATSVRRPPTWPFLLSLYIEPISWQTFSYFLGSCIKTEWQGRRVKLSVYSRGDCATTTTTTTRLERGARDWKHLTGFPPLARVGQMRKACHHHQVLDGICLPHLIAKLLSTNRLSSLTTRSQKCSDSAPAPRLFVDHIFAAPFFFILIRLSLLSTTVLSSSSSSSSGANIVLVKCPEIQFQS